MLRELGAEESQIGRALFFQIGISSSARWLWRVIHSVFGLKFCELLLVTMGDPRLLESVTQAGGIIVAVYGRILPADLSVQQADDPGEEVVPDCLPARLPGKEVLRLAPRKDGKASDFVL